MNTRKTKDEEIRVYLTIDQKNQLKRHAEIEQKSLSEYLRDAALTADIDSAKIDFYQSVNSELKEHEKSLQVAIRLLLHVLWHQTQNNEKVDQIYAEAIEDVENFLGRSE